MTDAAIPLKAVRDALMLAVIRRKSDRQIARFAAFTRYPSPFGPTCADRRRVPQLDNMPPMHFGPLAKGDMERLLLRHRLEAGLAGVRRTWGIGVRQLQAEFAQGGVR